MVSSSNCRDCPHLWYFSWGSLEEQNLWNESILKGYLLEWLPSCGPLSPTMAISRWKSQESGSCLAHETRYLGSNSVYVGILQKQILIVVTALASAQMNLPVRVRTSEQESNSFLLPCPST